MPPRTIDNLGVDVSTRYAQDQQLLDEKILQEAKKIPVQTEIDVTIPSFSSAFDQLFETSKRNLPWADFFPPEGYHEQKKRLFTFQLIPSLGSQDKREEQARRILAKIEETSLQREKSPDSKANWRASKEATEQKREEKTLSSLLHSILGLDKDMADVLSKRSQYQKG